MTIPIKFSELALENTIEIHENLESFKNGLGDRFYEKLREVYEQIKHHKGSYQILDEDTSKRRAFLKLTKKLHFRIIYEILPEYIEIQAIKSTYQAKYFAENIYSENIPMFSPKISVLLFLILFNVFSIGCSSSESGERGSTMAHPTQKSLMAIFSHPDDESTIAPILHRYVQEGVKVYLVIATDGRLGVNDFSGLEAGDGLVAIRKEEMKCSAEKLGVELIHLDYHDQLKAAEGYDGHMPHAKALILEIHQLIAELKPDILITWGPDGGSNHMDHRLIEATVSGVFLSQEWEKPTALYYYGNPSSWIEDGEAKKLRGVADRYMTTRISYSNEDFEAAIASMECHKSQFQVEGLRTRMMKRKRGEIALRKFVGPAPVSASLFEK